jgi:hypothetical protein
VTPQDRLLLERAMAGEIHGWRGLPDGVTHEDLAAFGGGGPAMAARLSGMTVSAHDYTTGAGRTRAFFDDDDHAFLLWIDDPFPPDQTVLPPADLGAPEAELVGVGDRLSGSMQLVWASRGLTLFVSIGRRAILGLALYKPTDVSYYRTWLGATESTPYRPRGRR